MIRHRIQPAYLLAVVLALAFFRLVPHPPNATPIAAMALFSSVVFSNRLLAYLVPLAAMLLSDIVIGLHSTIWYVYAGIAITVFIGSTLKQISITRVGTTAILASICFFIITNFGAWLHHDMYPRNSFGLLQAYMAGLPFLRNALIANLLFTFLLFYGLSWFRDTTSTQGIRSSKPRQT